MRSDFSASRGRASPPSTRAFRQLIGCARALPSPAQRWRVNVTPLLREFDVLARLLVFVLPSRLSEELVGDLIEEARTFIAPASGARAARRWLLVQLASSLPHMLSLHLERELKMDKGKIWGALVIVLMGALQAWDSGVLGAPPAIDCSSYWRSPWE